MTAVAIIVGAGQGLRFQSKSQTTPKQFFKLAGQLLIIRALQPFVASEDIDKCIAVVPQEAVDWFKEEVARKTSGETVRVMNGGVRRQDSVRRGVEAASGADVVVIHDAVRPFVRPEWISTVINLCNRHDGAVLAIPASDTLKKVVDGRISRTINRDNIWQAQTPQAFKRDILLQAYDSVKWETLRVTDEAQLLEITGKELVIAAGSSENIKITTQEDWARAKVIWEKRYGD